MSPCLVSTPLKKSSQQTAIKNHCAAAGMLALMLAGCASSQQQDVTASMALPNAYISQDGMPIDAAELASWWLNFGDPKLSNLIDRALLANNDLAEARARLAAARAGVKIARGARLPSITAGAAVNRQEIIKGGGAGSTGFQIDLDAAWEADLFGGIRASEAAARAGAESSEALLYDIQRTILAEVALNYIDLREAQAQLAVTKNNLAIQNDNLQISRWRHQAGLVSALDVEQATSLRDQTVARMPVTEQIIARAIYGIDVLTGQNPGSSIAALLPVEPMPVAPDNIAAGLPAQLLQRRPDIVAAQRNLAAESALIGVAQADLYPQLRLSGILSSSSLSLGGLVDMVVGNLIGSVTAPIFQGGQIRARIDQQKANMAAALASYRATVLTALADVENALVAVERSRERETALMLADRSARESIRLSEMSYRNGLSDFTALLNAQRDLLLIQDSLATATAARATAAIQLYKALGGGWSPQSGALNSGPDTGNDRTQP